MITMLRGCCGVFLLALAMFACVAMAADRPAAPVLVMTVESAIGPATADYVVRGVQRAGRESAQLIVLRLDTPGGLDASMRAINKAILGSSVPIATYVAPGGARAASAGTYILYASHIAAMSPGTNLGAATPVQIGGPEDDAQRPRKDTDKETDDTKAPQSTKGTLTKKQISDAAAYLRGLAQLRGRNAEWAEQAVRESVSLSAEEALKSHVIDYLAENLDELLRQLDGKSVAVLGKPHTLHTLKVRPISIDPDWRTRLLSVITEPSVALLLMMIGIYGIFFEFANPGFVAPGVIGAICLLVALFALHLLPVNYAGLALILLGIALMIAEHFLPSFGIVGIGGVVALAIGAVLLIDTDVPGFGVSVTLVAAIAVVSALLFLVVGGMAMRARARPVVSGREELIGATGEIVQSGPNALWARIHGELWQVRSNVSLAPGQQVQVVALHGLTLIVRPQSSSTGGV